MIEVDSKEDLDKMLVDNETLLVLFYASWCPFCRRFVPVFDCKTASFNGAQVIHVVIDDYDNQLWDDYEIDAVPTIIFFEKGKVTKRLDGRFGVGLNEKQLGTWLHEFKI
jgi:thiol-disulfide isomerase/thioredoxin